jgi:hypothetical protein
MDAKKLIHEQARLPEETVPICLRGDLVAQFEKLERDLDKAQRKSANSLAGAGTRQLAQEIEALREEMEASTVVFHMRGMPDKRWQALTAQHPPRRTEDGDVHDRDKLLGVNSETFFPALVKASTFEPELDAEDWAVLLGEGEEEGKLTHRQKDQLHTAAWRLNRRDVDIPFSYAASKILNSEPE